MHQTGAPSENQPELKGETGIIDTRLGGLIKIKVVLSLLASFEVVRIETAIYMLFESTSVETLE